MPPSYLVLVEPVAVEAQHDGQAVWQATVATRPTHRSTGDQHTQFVGAPSFYCERRVRRVEPPIFSLTRPALRSLVALKPQTPPTKQEGDCQPELRKLVPIFWSLGGGVAPKKVSTAPFLRVPENFPSAYLYASPWEKCLDISNSRLS